MMKETSGILAGSVLPNTGGDLLQCRTARKVRQAIVVGNRDSASTIQPGEIDISQNVVVKNTESTSYSNQFGHGHRLEGRVLKNRDVTVETGQRWQ
jgi:hypothetical protein